jgi:hypothetical protein
LRCNAPFVTVQTRRYFFSSDHRWSTLTFALFSIACIAPSTPRSSATPPAPSLFGGMCATFLVFLAAAPDTDPDMVGYRLVGGHVFPVNRADSLRAIRTLESVGGSANADAAELDDWIGALWRGRRLCYMLVVAQVLLAGL